MNWNEVTIHTKKEALEPLSAVIMDMGISSFVVEDPEEILSFLEESRDTYDMVDDELREDIEKAGPSIRLYVSDDEEGVGLMHALTDRLADLEKKMPGIFGGLTVSIVSVRDEDWQYNWREFFRPFSLGEKLYVRPAWEEFSPEGVITVKIDPGSSFGSGQHETTRMALEALEKYITPGCTAADIGSGSGILSAAAALLGACRVIAVDIDPNAVTATRECAVLNGVEDRVEAVCSDLAEALDVSPDVTVANIFAGPICVLAGQLSPLLAQGSVFISTGIIESRQDEVASALEENGFEIIEKRSMGQWYLLAGRKK
ncbi:MAG: 50S ribosomal protein L11 methyltransferase [Eubacteriaceae bacterium]|nr:50S ribosomal protein L11 methyltransferase [Eubacteriaceae bacterium]